MDKGRREKRIWIGTGLFFLFLMALLQTLLMVGTDSGLYYRQQMQAEILPAAGVDEATLQALDNGLATYLSGDAQALDSFAGTQFNDTEMAHMADCFQLFELLRRAIWCALAVAALLLIIGALRAGRDFFAVAARQAPRAGLCLAALIAVLALWGIFDFDALFTAFHRLLFTNDLWLLNPETDLLIRICPQSMFVAMAIRIGVLTLLFIVTVCLISKMIASGQRRRRG